MAIRHFIESGFALLIATAPSETLKAQQVLFTFYGDHFDDAFGASVSTAGDVNLDGIIDLMVGAPELADCAAGYVRIFSGKDGKPLFKWVDDCNDPYGDGDHFGGSESRLGDIDGDGYDDEIVGSVNDAINGIGTGSAKVFTGKTGALLYTLLGIPGTHQFGNAVAAAGDLNADGVP